MAGSLASLEAGVSYKWFLPVSLFSQKMKNSIVSHEPVTREM